MSDEMVSGGDLRAARDALSNAELFWTLIDQSVCSHCKGHSRRRFYPYWHRGEPTEDGEPYGEPCKNPYHDALEALERRRAFLSTETF